MWPTNVDVNTSHNTISKKINYLVVFFINWVISYLLSILQYGLMLLKSYFLGHGYCLCYMHGRELKLLAAQNSSSVCVLIFNYLVVFL